MKKILEKINISMIVLMIALSTMLIGTPLSENNVHPVYVISGIFSAIFFIKEAYAKLKGKTDFKINVMDICVMALIFSGLIPLIFKTYASLDGTTHIVLKYFYILGLYFIAKNECKKNPKNVEVIRNTVIFSILLLCIIGLDEIHHNWFKEIKAFFGYSYVEYDEVRIGSLFSYPNAMAAVAGSGVFLCLGYVFYKQNVKMKILYGAISLVMLVTLVLTYSRLVYIVFAGACLVYGLILCKKYNVKEYLSSKVAVILAVLATIVITYIIAGLQIPKKFVLEGKYQKILYSVEPDTEYVLEFDVNDLSNVPEGFVIRLTEKNEYFDNENVTEVKIGGSGTKEVKVHTKSETSVMYLNIEAIEEENYGKLEISGARLNGEKFILKYKLIPTSIVQKIQSISLKNKSVWERFEFIQNALTTIKTNWLFGFGGNAWRTIQYKSQAYNAYATEVHSFPVQVFLENGIIGFVAVLGIYFGLAKYLLLEVKKSEMDLLKISLIVAIGFVLVHSILDFDMSFFYVALIIFLMIATINFDREKFKMRGEIALYIVLIFASIGSLYVSVVEMNYKSNTEILRVSKEWPETRIFGVYNKFMPFDKDVKLRLYRALSDAEQPDYVEIEKTLRLILENEKYSDSNIRMYYVYSYFEACLETEQNLEENLNFILEYIYDTEGFAKYQPMLQIDRIGKIKKIARVLKENRYAEFAEKFENQAEKELAEKEQYILNFRKARYDERNVEEYKKFIENIDNLEEL